MSDKWIFRDRRILIFASICKILKKKKITLEKVKSSCALWCIFYKWVCYKGREKFQLEQETLVASMGKTSAASGRSIPEDIEFEILTRLPVKSLCRFRCVCSRWLSIISSPRFNGFIDAHYRSCVMLWVDCLHERRPNKRHSRSLHPHQLSSYTSVLIDCLRTRWK